MNEIWAKAVVVQSSIFKMQGYDQCYASILQNNEYSDL